MGKKKRKRKVKRRRKHQRSWKTYLIIIIGLILGLRILEQKYVAFQLERYNVEILDKANLDLSFIINYIDEAGGGFIQLNWQEITAISAVNQYNQVSTITERDLQKVVERFINGEEVLSFRAVVDTYGYTLEQKKLAYKYLSELKNHGYMPQKLQSDSKEMQFINSIKEAAILHYHEYGILPSITIAQAIIESHWGQSQLAKEANNLFGIKASANWGGESTVFETKEYYNTEVVDAFRKYDTHAQSIIDHADFLVSNPRYETVLLQQTYQNQALKLQEAGYSTATDEFGNKIYAKKLIELIRQYNLQLIDHEVKHDYK